MANTKYTTLRALSRSYADACDMLNLAKMDGKSYSWEQSQVESAIRILRDYVNRVFYPVDDDTFRVYGSNGCWEVYDVDESLLIEGYHNRITFY